LKDIIIFDIANNVYNRPHIVLSNSCQRFLLVNHSYHLCKKKINDLLRKLSAFFSEDEIDHCRKKVLELKKDIWFYVRGHFLTTWIYKLIKTIAEKSGSSIDITYDALYSEFVHSSNFQYDVKPLIKNIKIAAKAVRGY
jgi:hypothetical protein